MRIIRLLLFVLFIPISSLAAPNDSLAPTSMFIQSFTLPTIDDKTNSQTLVDNQTITPTQGFEPNLNVLPLSKKLIPEVRYTKNRQSESTSLPSDNGRNDSVPNGIQNSKVSAFKDIRNLVVKMIYPTISDNKSQTNDPPENNGSSGDSSVQGNGWNEEVPSVESDVIWRKYYTGK